MQLAAVGVGQRAEGVVVPKTSETERALGHRTILACPLRIAAVGKDRNTGRAADSSLSSRRVACFFRQKHNARTKRRTEMGKIVITENVTLDGVVQDPSGDEGFDRGGWVGRVMDRPAVGKAVMDEAMRAEAQLFGRRTYEFLAARWPSRSGALADRLNSMPKYVVSSTLDAPVWNNSMLLKGNAVDEVSKLREQIDGEIVVAGSIQLARTLLEHDLVDELRLMVYPVVVGAGERLFGDTGEEKPMRLVRTDAGDGVAFLTYEVVREA
jgi:dihydrofolate reductase